MGVLPHHKGWGDFLTNLEWVVVDEAHTYRGVFGSHVANVLRRLERTCRLYRANPRFMMASATIANPGELGRAACRRTGRGRRLRHGSPRRPADRHVEPAADRGTHAAAPLAALRGRRAARRPRLRGHADDLLPQVAQGHRADPAVRPDAAGGARPGRSRGSDRPVPRRLHAAAAPGDRGPPGGRRPPRRGRDRRPRAGHRHRRARRLDLRDLPGHGGQPAPDVGEGGPAQRGAGRLHRRRRRPRPVLLPPSGRVPRPPGRGGDPRSRERADPWPPRAGGRLRGAARRIGLAAGRRRRPHPRCALARARGRAGRRGCAAAKLGPALPPAGPGLPGGRDLAALGLARLGRRGGRELRRDAGDRRGGAGVRHGPPGRRLPPHGAVVRGARARRRDAPGDRRALRRRLVHAAEEGDERLHRGVGRGSSRRRAFIPASISTSATCP